jgi:uncharacterized protein HemX
MSISPNVPSPQESYHYDTPGTPRWIAVLFVVLFAGLAVLAYVGHSQQGRLEQDLLKQQDQNKVMSAQLEQANSRLADLKGHLEVTEQKVGMTQSELAQARSRSESGGGGPETDRATHPGETGKRRKNRRGGHRCDRREKRHRKHQD